MPITQVELKPLPVTPETVDSLPLKYAVVYTWGDNQKEIIGLFPSKYWAQKLIDSSMLSRSSFAIREVV